jgi:hypothetical protein
MEKTRYVLVSTSKLADNLRDGRVDENTCPRIIWQHFSLAPCLFPYLFVLAIRSTQTLLKIKK